MTRQDVVLIDFQSLIHVRIHDTENKFYCLETENIENTFYSLETDTHRLSATCSLSRKPLSLFPQPPPFLLLLLEAGCTKSHKVPKCQSHDTPCSCSSFIARQAGLQQVLSGGVCGCDVGDPLTFCSLAAGHGPLPPLPLLHSPPLPRPHLSRFSLLLHLQRERQRDT